MSIKTWIAQRLGLSSARADPIDTATFFDLSADVYIRELAFWACANLIANAVSKCEFKTYVRGKEVKGDEYYLWNIAPNQNQNSSAFLHKLIAQLYRNNEALIIEQNDRLFVADSYNRTRYVLYDDVFTGVAVDDFTFSRSFAQSEVLFFQLSERDMRRVTAGLYESYSKLIAYGMKSYQKSRGMRGVLSIDTLKNPQWEKSFQKLQNENFKQFFNAENAVLPLFNGYTYTDLGSKTYSNEGTRDIRAMIDDVSDFTAKAFGIPPALLSGKVEGVKDALDSFLTFCVDPLCDMLAEEINRKRTGKAEFLAGTRIEIDTRCIQHVDLLGAANAIDKLISSGTFCINDIRRALGEPPIKEPWAYQHFITKNYDTVASVLTAMEGGEKRET